MAISNGPHLYAAHCLLGESETKNRTPIPLHNRCYVTGWVRSIKTILAFNYWSRILPIDHTTLSRLVEAGAVVMRILLERLAVGL